MSRINIIASNIYIKSATLINSKAERVDGILEFDSAIPVINVLEGNNIIRQYKIETLNTNPDLKGQFLHYSVSVQENDAVMIDGVISTNKDSHLSWTDDGYEACRFQPFFLKRSDKNNDDLIGKGLFARGLHYSGTVTPKGVRCVCICDHCKQSFTLQHIHAGFSEIQYLYSADGMKTLLIGYNELQNVLTQLQKDISEEVIVNFENELPEPYKGKFKYYNPLRCYHCEHPFIDFDHYKEIRPFEYYANKFINTEFYRLDSE